MTTDQKITLVKCALVHLMRDIQSDDPNELHRWNPKLIGVEDCEATDFLHRASEHVALDGANIALVAENVTSGVR